MLVTAIDRLSFFSLVIKRIQVSYRNKIRTRQEKEILGKNEDMWEERRAGRVS